MENSKNRIIKFRAWNSSIAVEKMLHWDFLQSIHIDEVFNIPHLKLMQFTNLLDKNGKEIYEGDIVEDKNVYYWIAGENDIPHKKGDHVRGTIRKDKEPHYKRYVVEYKNEIAGFYPFSGPAFGGYEYENAYLEESEVIGNIHQNPELIK